MRCLLCLVLIPAAACELADEDVGSATQEIQDWCDPYEEQPPYDHYPLPGYWYVQGPPSQFGWQGRYSGYPGASMEEDFDVYYNWETVDDSNGISRDHLNVTRGTLTARQVGSYKRGWTENERFRVVGEGWWPYWGNGYKVAWTDQRSYFRFWSKGLTGVYGGTNPPPPPGDTGVSIYGRYRTSHDLYVGKYSLGGQMKILRKTCNENIQLALDTSIAEPIEEDEWYWMDMEVFTDPSTGYNVIYFRVWPPNHISQDPWVLSVVDNLPGYENLPWGTFGIRSDYMRLYLDDWELLTP